MTTDLSRNVADSVRAELARRQMTQRQMADVLGISQASVARRLGGHVPFDVDELAAVAELLDMDPRDLLPAAAATTQ